MIRRIPFAFVAAGLLTACAGNPYAETYRPNTSASLPAVLPAAYPAEVVAGRYFEADGDRLAKGGWVFIGSSSFSHFEGRKEDLLAHARAVRASLVIVYDPTRSFPHLATLPSAASSGEGDRLRASDREEHRLRFLLTPKDEIGLRNVVFATAPRGSDGSFVTYWARIAPVAAP